MIYLQLIYYAVLSILLLYIFHSYTIIVLVLYFLDIQRNMCIEVVLSYMGKYHNIHSYIYYYSFGIIFWYHSYVFYWIIRRSIAGCRAEVEITPPIARGALSVFVRCSCGCTMLYPNLCGLYGLRMIYIYIMTIMDTKNMEI